MKELDTFRKFLNEDLKSLFQPNGEKEDQQIDPNQPIYNIQYTNKRYIINLYVFADELKEAKEIAYQYMRLHYHGSLKYNDEGSYLLNKSYNELEVEEKEAFRLFRLVTKGRPWKFVADVDEAQFDNEED